MALRQGGGRHQGDAGVDLAEPERAELAGLGVAVEVDVVEGLQQLLPVPQQAVDRGPHGGELRRDYGGGGGGHGVGSSGATKSSQA